MLMGNAYFPPNSGMIWSSNLKGMSRFSKNIWKVLFRRRRLRKALSHSEHCVAWMWQTTMMKKYLLSIEVFLTGLDFAIISNSRLRNETSHTPLWFHMTGMLHTRKGGLDISMISSKHSAIIVIQTSVILIRLLTALLFLDRLVHSHKVQNLNRLKMR